MSLKKPYRAPCDYGDLSTPYFETLNYQRMLKKECEKKASDWGLRPSDHNTYHLGNTAMSLPAILSEVEEKPYVAATTNGQQRTFKTKKEAEDWGETLVQKNEDLEVVIMKAVSEIHAERPPVVRKDIK